METTKGSLFGAYNAVTGYFQNVKSYKDTETKFKSIMTGNALGKAQATFDLCREFSPYWRECIELGGLISDSGTKGRLFLVLCYGQNFGRPCGQ